VALGTVADPVPLDRNNRILVEQGLRRMRAGLARPGIAALLEIGRKRIEALTASDLAFAVAPRLNAAGRLDDMQRGVDCLQASNADRARALAGELDALNLERRSIEADMHQDALAAADALSTQWDQAVPSVFCLHDTTWHQGVCGIIAGRLKEHYHRPAFVFADAGDGTLRGSARSIPGLHIRDVMAAIDAKRPGLLHKFGGHAMAAGLTLSPESLDRFREDLEEVITRHFAQHPPQRELLTDGSLKAEDFSLELAHQLRYAAPWGQAFAEPSFDSEFTVESARVVGEKHLKLTLTPAVAPSLSVDAIAFGQADMKDLQRCHAVFRLDVNHWRGRDSLQLMIEHLAPR